LFVDLTRTFPENIYFRNPGEDQTEVEKVESLIPTLRKILHAFSIYKPEVGYCQGNDERSLQNELTK
jgi:hypothetical protein